MNILDTRYLKDRLEELESEHETLQAAVEEGEENAQDDLAEFEDSEEFREMKELKEMEEEIPEWQDGETLINTNYWVEYCQELLEDIGEITKNLPHYIVIDWEATAENIKADYSEIDYLGQTYYYRST